MRLDFRKPLPQTFNTSSKKMNSSDIYKRKLQTEKKNPNIKSQIGIKYYLIS